jgi:hypothetical protein
MSSSKNCASCVGPRGECEDSQPRSNDLQGQINMCSPSAGWNYGQSATFQMRNMPAPSHGFLETTNPMSFSLENPARYRPFTHMPVKPHKIANGALKLNSDGLHDLNKTNVATWSPIVPKTTFSELPPGNFNSSYCGAGFHNCYYNQGLTQAGPARDGCVSASTPCSMALSGI